MSRHKPPPRHPLLLVLDLALIGTLIYQVLEIMKRPELKNGPGNTPKI